MPKKSKTNGAAPNGVGHNSKTEITDTETADLMAHFSLKIRAQRHIVEQRKADLEIERDALNALFSSARGELRINRKDFENVLALQDMSEAEFREHEAKRLGWMKSAGLPVGTQLELFAENETVDDKFDAEANGYRAGRRADDPTPPSFIAPSLRNEWMTGWHRGQEANAEALGRAAAILEKREAKKVGLKPTQDPDAGAAGEGGTDSSVVAGPWSEPTEAEGEFEHA